MSSGKSKITIAVLLLLVAVLSLLVVYSFVLKPAVTGYAVKSQNNGIEYALTAVVQASANCQVVPLTVGELKVNLVDVNCLQQNNEISLEG
ncbi:MAG TPA: hypothetical protein VJ208_03695 [Candidatus Nanoarchaeia archaeon]|nr:hypothetical protein [Candidatus Nanoarchaeia archaeon]